MAETFGEADVILRVRLDQLKRDLDASERMIIASDQRVAHAQLQTQQQIESKSQPQEHHWIKGAAKAIIAWKLLRKAIYLVKGGLDFIPAAAGAAGAALSAAVVGATVGVALLGGLLTEVSLKGERGAGKIIDAFKGLDGTTEKARELAEQLARIPIIGGLISSTYKGISGHSQLAQESWQEWISTVQDGEVKVGLLGKAVNGLFNAIPAVGLARLMGVDTDFVGDIEKANEAIRENNRLLQLRRAIATQLQPVSGAISGQGQSSSRDSSTADLKGVELVRAHEKYKAEDQKKFFDDRRQQIQQAHSDALAAIDELAKKEKLNTHQTMQLKRQLAHDITVQTASLNVVQAKADKDLEEAAKKRIKLAQQEEAAQKKIVAAKAASNLAQLTTGAKVTDLQTAGKDFEASRVQNEADRQAAILQDQNTGQASQLEAINRFYDAKAKLINKREKDQRTADGENADNAKLQMLAANEQLRSSILQSKLSAQGQAVQAQQEAIRQRFQQQIDQMEAQGNKTGADLARRLRDIQENAVGNLAIRNMADANAALESQIKQQELRDAGKGVEANLERIKSAHAQTQKQLEAAGNTRGVELDKKLASLELAAAGKPDAAKVGQGQQVVLSRFSAGLGDSPQDQTRLAKDSLDELKKINQNTKNDKPVVAVAG